MEAIKKLPAIAIAEVGYHEKASWDSLDDPKANSGDQNFTKYARDLHEAGFFNGSKQGCEWCTSFVVWCFYKLCGSRELTERVLCFGGPYAASCGWASDYYKDAGRLDRDFRVGDQIFFGDFAHTGIIVDIRGGKIYTIEGNSGNKVQHHDYRMDDPWINCVGHPRYDLIPVEKPVAPPPAPKPKPDPVYAKLAEMPCYLQDGVRPYVEDGSLKGYGDERGLDLTDREARLLTVVHRHVEKMKKG